MMLSRRKYMFRDWINPTEVYNSRTFSANPHPDAIEWLSENRQNIDWNYLSMNINPDAIGLLLTNMDKINWDNLSLNSSEAAINLLKKNRSQIRYHKLALNPNMKMLDLIDIQLHWYTMLSNPNRDIRKIAIHFAWTYSLNPPGTEIDDIEWGHPMYPYSLNHLLSLEHRSIKISLKKLIRVTKNYIPEMMLNIYKDDPLLVDHVEKHLDNFSKNDEVEWDKLKMLWCNPGIFKRSVDVSILTEDSLLNKSDSDVDLLRNELYSMRTQLNDFKSYLSKKEINRHRQSSISTDGRPSVTIDSLDDENILSRQSSIDETEGIVEQIREETSEGTVEQIREDTSEGTSEDTLTRTNLNDAQDEEITKLKILRDAQSSEISALKNIIDSQATKIAALSSTIDEQARHSNTLSNTVIGQANKIETLTRSNVEQANMLATLSSTVNEQSDMIKSLTSSNDSQHIQILSMKDKIDTQDASITALNSIHNKQIEDLRRYNDVMNEHVIEIELLRSEKEFQLNEISTLRRTIIYQEQRFNETVDSINSIASNLDDEDMPLFSCW